ncbi:MAG: glutamate-5-semialdehyde dehydrogenase [Candidatus Pseudoruminococcus sp.]|nr:glutamate-5-semialdehyde dehydrogenase [Ruminococcus sp.]MDY2783779.1 glutamate-5-semialdehyde dehydrogenase [Candidatus Pseudoruminococcus sp.]
MTILEEMGKKAKEAARTLAVMGEEKNDALKLIAKALIDNTDAILAANKIDVDNGRANGLTESIIDRLSLSKARIEGMAQGVLDVAALPDPVGAVLSGSKRPNGLNITKVRVPIGVIGIIFEARPNVTSDAASLCLKSGNAVILRGGKEAINSNKCIADIMRSALEKSALDKNCIQLIEDTTRQSSVELMGLVDYLDLLIPRGGAGLIKAVVENAKVPVIETGVGNCHVFVDESADIDMAANIIYNAKTSRPSVCNAIETILVHSNIAEKALPVIKARLDEKNVELRGCERTREILGDSVIPAVEADWATEYLDYILAVKVVDSIDEAIAHITKYSSGHSECIVTENYKNANRFKGEVDAAAVYVNASTRFTDGGMFGLGAEIGISTQKIHARGPMGLNELTSMKFIIEGDGQIR